MPCNVQQDEDLAGVFERVREVYGRLDFLVHSIAFAPPGAAAALRRDEPRRLAAGDGHQRLQPGDGRRAAAALMTGGGTIITISYFGGEKVVPGYNVMGVCKAALEHSVRYLAWDLAAGRLSRQLHQRRPDADTERRRHRRLRRVAPARRPEIAAGPQRRAQGTRPDGLYLLGDFQRRHRRNGPRRLRLQHRGTVIALIGPGERRKIMQYRRF